MNDKDKDMEYNYGSDADEAEVKAKKKKYTKSFYIIFALCLCAIGVAGFYTYSDVADYMNKAKNPSITQTASEPQNKQAEAKVDGVTKSTQPTDSPTQPTEKETEQPTEPATQQAATVSPVGDNPEVIQGYSADKLVYFETLKDWRVHTGTDFGADKNSEVYSMADGTVTSVFSGDLYGDGIQLEFSDGITANYLGVKPADNIKAGTQVSAGEAIGSANGVPCEQNLKNHIHVELKKDGRYINPETFLNTKDNS